MSNQTRFSFAQDLLNWYKQNKRQFPWRAQTNVYHTWICEVMSQQTTLSVVLPRFQLFVKALPTVADLATCSEDKLRELWAGLGYYARARNLKKGAHYIVEECHSIFPKTKDEWLKVPGCGPYTAAVIASICFKERVAAVDGNVIRVASRILELSEGVWEKTGQEKIYCFVNNLTPAHAPGDFNEAMMDLGATLCSKQNPDCPSCPVQKYCLAYQNKTVEKCPPVKIRKDFKQEDLFVCILLRKKNAQCLLLNRNSGFLAKTKGFPLLKSSKQNLRTELTEYGKAKNLKVEFQQKNFSHTITHHKITGHTVLLTDLHNKFCADDFLHSFAIAGQSEWVGFSQIKEKLASSLDLKALKTLSL